MSRVTIRCASALVFAGLVACAKHEDASSADAVPADAAPDVARTTVDLSITGRHYAAPVEYSGPSGDVTLGAWKASVPVPDAQAVLSRIRPKFRLCYNQGLQQDGGIAGELTLSAKVAADGSVDSVSVTKNIGVPEPVVKCVSRALYNAEFDAPGPHGATLDVPMRLVPLPDAGP